MSPFDTTFLTHERIDDLVRVSADIHRGPEGATVASRLVGALPAPLLPIAARLESVVSTIAAAVGIRRPAART